MPKPPLPSQLDQFLAQPNPAVIASLRPDGSPHTAATWYLWEDGRVLVNMDESRRRLEYIRADPRVSITVLGQADWYHHLTLVGRATLEPDRDLEGIDRLSRHYMGAAYSVRDQGRVNAWIEIESWHSWAMGKPWVPSD
jgi:PPOX class probable F420-dependent enzyme